MRNGAWRTAGGMKAKPARHVLAGVMKKAKTESVSWLNVALKLAGYIFSKRKSTRAICFYMKNGEEQYIESGGSGSGISLAAGAAIGVNLW